MRVSLRVSLASERKSRQLRRTFLVAEGGWVQICSEAVALVVVESSDGTSTTFRVLHRCRDLDRLDSALPVDVLELDLVADGKGSELLFSITSPRERRAVAEDWRM